MLTLAQQAATLPDLATQAAQGIAAHPWIVHLGIGLVFGFGLALSFMGKKLVRPGFILLGMAAGAILGHLAPPALALGGQPLATVAVLALLGGLLGWLFFRVFVANSLGVVLAVAATLATAAYFRVSPPKMDLAQTIESVTGATNDQLKDGVSDAVDKARKAIENAVSGDGPAATDTSATDAQTQVVEQAAQRSADLLQELARRISDQATDFWNYALTPAARFALTMSTLGGYLLGLVLGFLLPSKASAVTTAIVGPAVWIPAGVYLIHAASTTWADRLPTDPKIWLAIWAAAAVLGLVVQLAMSSKKKPKAPGNDA